jgi:hypothetical protein
MGDMTTGRIKAARIGISQTKTWIFTDDFSLTISKLKMHKGSQRNIAQKPLVLRKASLSYREPPMFFVFANRRSQQRFNLRKSRHDRVEDSFECG